MRVLHILNELRPSGAEVMLKIAAPYWQERGVELHVLSTGQVKGIFADNLANAGFTVHHIPFSNSAGFYTQVIRLMRTARFDVVHLHTEHATLTYALLARYAGIPRIIRTIHSTFIFRGITQLTRAIRRFITRKLGVLQVSVSKTIQENEVRRLGNPTILINKWYDNLHFIPLMDGQKEASRTALGIKNSQKCLITVGNCSAVKNHKAVIQALRLLEQRNIHLIYFHY